ncbi:MAG TPA: 23S rRNA (uracil(1939)-C(5))-methyltransferase RlmD [Clostridiales bacterium]|nr:MAG: 23S rRNA (uracil-5-)-methyltransferase RumA [Clostridiales bacterium GWD2_32_59]HAN09387.1 23S rRNA (uracil(1939)-C(5))-methyltransferase RlmD [Clostridiales bacterium]
MNIKLNEDYEVEIIDMGTEGEGIGKIDGITIFVNGGVKGDTVKVKITKVSKNYVSGKIIKLIKESEIRHPASCKVANKCGGCQIQQIKYEEQLKIKEKIVKDALERIGKLSTFNFQLSTIIRMDDPYHYRNKAMFPVGIVNGKLAIGCYKHASHEIVDTDKCIIQDRTTEKILKIIRNYLQNKYLVITQKEKGKSDYESLIYDDKTHTGLIRNIMIRNGYKTGEIMVCIIINGESIIDKNELVYKLKSIKKIKSIVLNINTNKGNSVLGDKTRVIDGQDHITDYIGDIKYKISARSFFQINPLQTEKLYEKALEYAELTGNEIVWDAYCGTGSISLFLAKKAKEVYGVEIIEEAINDAIENAKENGIENVEFFVGAAEEVIPRHFKETGVKPDVIVVDPPRKGCDDKLLRAIVEMKPDRVVYVSCNPATLARDLRYLCDGGYEVEMVQPVDMFPHTMHVETVVKLTQKV